MTALYTMPESINNRILDAGLSRQIAERFITSEPASGPYFYQIVTDDVPVVYNVRWTLPKNTALEFMLWLRDDNAAVLSGAQFNAKLWTEAGFVNQICSFSRGGTPRLDSIAGSTYSYSAVILVRDLNLIAGVQFLATEIYQPILTENDQHIAVETENE